MPSIASVRIKRATDLCAEPTSWTLVVTACGGDGAAAGKTASGVAERVVVWGMGAFRKRMGATSPYRSPRTHFFKLGRMSAEYRRKRRASQEQKANSGVAGNDGSPVRHSSDLRGGTAGPRPNPKTKRKDKSPRPAGKTKSQDFRGRQKGQELDDDGRRIDRPRAVGCGFGVRSHASGAG